MLNELEEYKQYTYDLDQTNPVKRLSHRNICNALSGIMRAMTIIARHEIGKDDKIEIKKAINALKKWCGDTFKDSDAVSKTVIREWLPNYIINILGKPKFDEFESSLTDTVIKGSQAYKEISALFKGESKNYGALCMDTFRNKQIREEILSYARQLSLLCEKDNEIRIKYAPVYRIVNALNLLCEKYSKFGFQRHLYNLKLAKPEKNDFKKITYEKIVADAIMQGPLTRYYLVCKVNENLALSSIYDNLKKSDTGIFESLKKNGEVRWSAPIRKKADLILKTVSACLLGQRYRGTQKAINEFTPVNFTDIENWLAGNSKMEELKRYTYKGEKLFITKSMDNTSFIGINKRWLEVCEWKVIPAQDLKRYLKTHPLATFYSDPGAGEYLLKNIMYSK